ncbi:MAG: DNA translocase FtsK, partial [Clostridia bacterium]|nr:DNA translocase FtsK [Clostridia bacterium]
MLLYGLFGPAAISIPLLLIIIAFFWRKDVVKRATGAKFFFSTVCLLLISVLCAAANVPESLKIGELWTRGIDLVGGGVIGSYLGWLLVKQMGVGLTVFIAIALVILFVMFIFGTTPYDLFLTIRYRIIRNAERRRAESEELLKRAEQQSAQERARRAYEQQEREAAAKRERAREEKKRNIINEDVTIDDMPSENTNNYSASDVIYIEDDDYSADGGIIVADMSKPDSDYCSIDPNAFDDALRGRESASDASSAPDYVEIISDEVKESIKAEKVDSPLKRPDDLDEILSDEDESESDGPLSDELIKKVTEGQRADGEDFDDIDDDDATFDVTRNPAAEELVPESYVKEAPPEYIFPPVSLLTMGPQPTNADISEELQSTAKKLVDTLTSFKVRTRIINVSRGPTITRYELAPEEGVKVRSILNLIDDISLNLATTGVRIEAPIPGKQAVGIEVPNRVVETVYLRSLIDTQRFRDSQSRLTACLGEDVAGDPILIDIAKMPHLLIAGATGMGKSVCINSLIVSLLYKSKPEELKLILIDPKKVELNIYNGLPHLIVPVVSDPKKAAGALAWAVGEMERRFTLIEEVGMRNIKGYNSVAKDDPTKEILPQIVIIIDELADLMMMAKDNVEESICRIAQKARAAGMHLIIGTQRPSVNVVTGLIKANVPSRIAFTMASQVDSRTIIDIAGAEKLIGRGDMLYAAVGQKPIRVQGAYVSEREIDAILEFIKSNYGMPQYDDNVIDSIEREAEKCVDNKKGAVGGEISDD